jgi:hypothetical protein
MNSQSLIFIRRSLLLAFVICTLTLFFYINIAFVLGALNGLLDFGSFIASGQLANQGENPYANNSPLIFSVYFPGINHSGAAPNLNPPISVLIFQQIANIPPMYSMQTWRILTIILYVWVIYLLIKRILVKTNPNTFWRVIWAFSLAGFWHTIQLGQIYTFLLLLVVGIIINMEKGEKVLAGILLGVLIALKPNFVFWAVALGITGCWSIFLSAGITAFFISLIPIFFYGFKIYQQWFEATKLFTPNLLIFPGNNSIQGLAAHFDSAQTGTVLSICLSIAIFIVVYKCKPSIFKINSLSIITSLLISPIAWTGYTILTLPIFLKSEKWDYEYWIAAITFTVPFFFILGLFGINFFNFVFWGWFYGWGLLALLIGEIAHIKKSDFKTEDT